ncbi:DUF6470 family protein [Lentibacillus sp. N15]|uniref:DUF6470 family protein n=1 Tax=Lentibacillus songyuanensis TaxID=3136161 RepID=UPI0031BBB9CC
MMHAPQIRMHSQMAQIHIQHTTGQQEIRQPQAEVSIQQPQAEITMRTTPSKLTIDQTKAWEDMNLMSVFKSIEKFADKGRQVLMDGINRRVQQGKELMQIENGENPLVTQVTDNAFAKEKLLGITFIPSPFAVKVRYQPSDLQINVQTHKPNIDIKPQQPIHHYQSGEVHTEMKQHPDLQIDVAYLNK